MSQHQSIDERIEEISNSNSVDHVLSRPPIEITDSSEKEHRDTNDTQPLAGAPSASSSPTSPQQLPIVENPQDGTLGTDPDDNAYEESIIPGGSIQIEPSLASREASRQNRHSQSLASNASNRRKRRRGRTIQIAAFQDCATTRTTNLYQSSLDDGKPLLPPLPENQYTVTLTRRAVKKLEESSDSSSTANSSPIMLARQSSAGGSTIASSSTMSGSDLNHQEDDYKEEYGDISLGMKLIVVSGRLIVQGLNALSDGRASPAQLAGTIQRGDILLSIDSLSLVNLPIDQLLNALKPLSSPMANGFYQRILHLRFEALSGMELLKSHEAAEAWKKDPRNQKDEAFDAANDMFSLFPMVDQLSGAPLFEAQEQDPDPEPEIVPVLDTQISSDTLSDKSGQPKDIVITDAMISEVLSKCRAQDRERFSSKFFLWNDDISEWLRTSAKNIVITSSSGMYGLTQTERVELGTQIMEVFSLITRRMEELDKGKDRRSFKSWTSSLSLRSRASTRRKYILDSQSLPVHRGHSLSVDLSVEEGSDEDRSDQSGSDFESLDGVTSDELLLGLAAHDDIWRKQVIDSLHQEIQNMDRASEVDTEEGKESEISSDIGTAISKELGSFLFGPSINKIVAQKKRPLALPPDEITAVIFDLATYVATSTPDAISIHGRGMNNAALNSSRTPKKMISASVSDDVVLATQFLQEQILPAWLDTFRPLPVEQRRLLWPRVRALNNFGSPGASSVISDDSLTVGSKSSVITPGRMKLHERIEEQEIDPETRAEACFLTTYYFVEQVLRACSTNDGNIPEVDAENRAKSFIRKYGSYLQIHTCFSRASSLHALAVFDELLKVAANDPVHREAMKEIQKTKNLNFYEPAKLSAVVEFLSSLQYEKSEKRRSVVIDLCVSAYPEIQPWQVRKACMEGNERSIDGRSRDACEEFVLHELYYKYLCLLLHHTDGHNDARKEKCLVKEWCEWSVGILPFNKAPGEEEKINERMENFLSIASKPVDGYLPYQRDLVMLLNLSMHIKKHDLSLNLLAEILQTLNLQHQPDVLQRVVECLENIGIDALKTCRETTGDVNLSLVRRVLQLFDKISRGSSGPMVAVADKLHAFLKHWASDALLDIIIEESSPADVLSALASWSREERELGPSLYSRLNQLLSKGVDNALQHELSGSLLRLKHARGDFKEPVPPPSPRSSLGASGIWDRMATGTLSIDK